MGETTDVTGVLEVLRGELARQHDRVNELRTIQIETVGRDGRNGKLQRVRADVDKLQECVEEHDRALSEVVVKVERMGVKLALLVTVAAIIGSAAAKLVLGG